METRVFRQFGTISFVIFLPFSILFIVLAIRSFIFDLPELFIFSALSVIFLFCLVTFCQLTIHVSSNAVSFKFGLGIWGKSYPMETISSCEVVKNSFYMGIGIKMIPNGWLYNVSGLSAIELKFKNKNSVVRIGTNKPDEVCEAIHAFLGENTQVHEQKIVQKKQWTMVFWIAFTVVILSLVIIPNFVDTKINIDSTCLEIKGIYGIKIPYNSIENCDTIKQLPSISLRTNGYAFGKTLTGYFKLADGTPVKLFVKQGNGPFIRIRSKDQILVFLNFEKSEETIKLYDVIYSKISVQKK